MRLGGEHSPHRAQPVARSVSWDGSAGVVPLRARAERAANVQRYRVSGRGKTQTLRCSEAPSFEVRVRRGRTVSASDALRQPPGTIFLDGAAQGAPFLLHERALYNLDHHEGCVRAFTLATCEQAMVLVSKRRDLRKRDWVVHVNDADLDTVLATWVLLNHLRLSRDTELRARVMPLLRLEGCIDAHGVEMTDFCALAPQTLAVAQAQMDRLRARELEIKESGRWDDTDLGEYIAERLQLLDTLFYSPGAFDELPAIEELARSEVGPGVLALVCRSRAGVYEVERELRRLYGDRVAFFALRKDDGTYTLRQMEGDTPLRLDDLYAQLNLIDPSSSGTRAENRWGGSDEIGGSPRKSGTRLTPEKLLASARSAYAGSGRFARAAAVFAAAVLATLVPFAGTPFPAVWGETLGAFGVPAVALPLLPPLALALLAGAFLVLAGQRAPGLFGLRRPSGSESLRLLPLAWLAAAWGGAWWPAVPAPAFPGGTVAGVALGVVGVELLFRGCIHGVLARVWRIQQPGGPWFFSVPVMISALLYAGVYGWCGAEMHAISASLPVALPLPASWWPTLCALFFGVAVGMARERSESVLAPLALHAGAIAMLAGVAATG